MAMDFIGLSVGMGYTDETVIGGGALKGKNCVVSNIEEVADGVNVTFQWTLDDGTVQTETVLLPKGTQGEAGKSAYQVWLDEGNTGSEEDFLNSLKGEKGADGTMTFEDLTEEQKESLNGEDGFNPIITENADNTDDVYKLDIETKDGILTTPNLKGQGGEFTRIKTIEIPIDRIHKDYDGNTSTKVALTKVNDYMKCLSFCIEESVFTENNVDVSKLLNIYLIASGQQGGYLMTMNPYGTSDIFFPGRSGINGTGGVRYVRFNLSVFRVSGNSEDSSTEFTVTDCKIRYEE